MSRTILVVFPTPKSSTVHQISSSGTTEGKLPTLDSRYKISAFSIFMIIVKEQEFILEKNISFPFKRLEKTSKKLWTFQKHLQNETSSSFSHFGHLASVL